MSSPSPPSQTFHPPPKILPAVPVVESVVGGAHYAGVRVDTLKHREQGAERRPSEGCTDHQEILNDLNELYCCRPTVEIFRRWWHSDAEFEDPLSKCKGYGEYAAQWFAMPKLFRKSETLEKRVMSSTENRVVYFQKQAYTFRVLGYTKVLDSIITVELGADDKIVRLVDEWDGKPIRGQILRRLNARITPWLVHVPK